MIDIEFIKGRLEAASPGPWDADGDIYAWENGMRFVLAYIGGHNHFRTKGMKDKEINAQTFANAIFIAHSRSDISTLLSEIERLHSVLISADNDMRGYCKICVHAKPCEGLETELAPYLMACPFHQAPSAVPVFFVPNCKYFAWRGPKKDKEEADNVKTEESPA